MFNEKGKIKFPNDSLSYQQDEFDYVLPSEMRKYESNGKRPYEVVTEAHESEE
jgi:hypothetical protein